MTTATEKEMLIADYDDRLASYESQYSAYRTWLDEDAQTGSVLSASMVWRIGFLLILWSLSGLIRCELFFIVAMSPLVSLLFLLLFVRSSFFTKVMLPLMLSSINSLLFGVRSTLLVLNCLLPPVSHARIRRLLLSFVAHDFLTQLRDEFEPLLTQLLARQPCVSLMDALAEVRNEETHFQDAGLLQSSSVLVVHSSVARPAAHVELASALVALSTVRGESIDLYCDYCGQDGYVETFCYRKKKAHKAQVHHSSQGTGGSSSGGSERSSAGSETQELIMLFCRLAASTSSRTIGSVTQPSTLTSPATASQSSTLGPPFAPSPGTYP
jgi:hypothetical protein